MNRDGLDLFTVIRSDNRDVERAQLNKILNRIKAQLRDGGGVLDGGFASTSFTPRPGIIDGGGAS